jgi:hypothetical protein
MAAARHFPSPSPSPSPYFVIAMVVSRLPSCRADASASRPLDSASATPSAYQRPAVSCPLAHFFLLAYVCWLFITLPLVAPPPPCIAFRRTAASRVHPRPPLFVSAGWLLRRILSHRLRLSTRRRLACCLLRHLRLTSVSLPSLAPPLSSPPLSAPRPLPASSNAQHTLPAAASPMGTVPSCPALVIQHVHLCRRIVIFTAQPSTILAQLSSYLGGR